MLKALMELPAGDEFSDRDRREMRGLFFILPFIPFAIRAEAFWASAGNDEPHRRTHRLDDVRPFNYDDIPSVCEIFMHTKAHNMRT